MSRKKRKSRRGRHHRATRQIRPNERRVNKAVSKLQQNGVVKRSEGAKFRLTDAGLELAELVKQSRLPRPVRELSDRELSEGIVKYRKLGRALLAHGLWGDGEVVTEPNFEQLWAAITEVMMEVGELRNDPEDLDRLLLVLVEQEPKLSREPGFECGTHGRSPKPWIVCIHVSDHAAPPAVVHRREEKMVAGEVLCAECLERIERKETPTENLRLACESCVLDRWQLQDAN